MLYYFFYELDNLENLATFKEARKVEEWQLWNKNLHVVSGKG